MPQPANKAAEMYAMLLLRAVGVSKKNVAGKSGSKQNKQSKQLSN
jgi:hypothetical protein